MESPNAAYSHSINVEFLIFPYTRYLFIYNNIFITGVPAHTVTKERVASDMLQELFIQLNVSSNYQLLKSNQ